MAGKLLLLAVTATAGFFMMPDEADARVRVWRGPNRSFVSVGPRYYGGYRGYRYGGYYAPSYSYSYGYPGYSYGYASPSYGYGYSYPSYGYGYSYGYPRYYGGRRFVAGPNRYYYRGPHVRIGGRW